MFSDLHLNKALLKTKGDFLDLVGQWPGVAQGKSDILILEHHLVPIFIRAHRLYDFYTEVH